MHINRAQIGVRDSDVLQQYKIQGIWKGIVESTKDPFGLGRLKIRVFPLHGLYTATPTKFLPWAEPCFPLFGGHVTPKVSDRVWLMFEAGDRNHPVWMGIYHAVPVGRPSQKHSLRVGTETPRETWTHSELEPQGSTIFRTHEGLQEFYIDMHLGDHFHSEYVIEDPSGKYFKMLSLFESPYESGLYDQVKDRVKIRKKDLSYSLQRDVRGIVAQDTGSHLTRSMAGYSEIGKSESYNYNSPYVSGQKIVGTRSVDGESSRVVAMNGPRIKSRSITSELGTGKISKWDRVITTKLHAPETW